ncbi:MAG: hypothetical protein PHI11_02570 [Gallionella sp.]|nr:hypothetical protein [Gallionella sp.]
MKILLLLSANHLHAQVRRGQVVVSQQLFGNTPAEREAFAHFLQTQKGLCYVLTDLIEEDFHLESLPYLRRRSRDALLQRKFSQLYPDTPFHLATELQRQSHGRRDVEMLLSALTNPSMIEPWLDILWAAQVPVVGIYSIAQLSGSLIATQEITDVLLVSYQKGAGLRQSYFKAGHLQFSRLTALSHDASFYDNQVKELLRTYHYLQRLNHLSVGQVLTVRLLCHSDDQAWLQQKLPDDADLHYEFAPLNSLGRILGCNEVFDDTDASALFLHQLATHPPLVHYGQVRHTHYFRLWQVRRILNRGSAVLFLLCAVWALHNVWGSLPDGQHATAMQSNTRQMQQQTQQIMQHLPQSTMPAADVKAAVLTMRQFKQSRRLPDAVLLPLSRVLDRFPDIQLDTLTWQINAADAAQGVMDCQAHFQPFTGNYRAALQGLEQFKAALQQQGYQVEVLTSPLQDGTATPLADARNTPNPTFNFSVKLRWQVST